MSSPYARLDRPPLVVSALRRALIRPGGLWTELDVREQTGSTNADVAAAARAGTPEGLVVVAERQTAGRGRLDRRWESPPRAGLALSVLFRPSVPASRLGWLPLLAGVTLVESVRRQAEVEAVLKWPNDLLIDDRKCAGILAEAVPDAGPANGQPAGQPAVVVGIGLNVTLSEAELPRPDATSLLLAGAAHTDRDPLLRALLRELADWYRRWSAVDGDPGDSGLREAYRLHCATLGRHVSLALPGGGALTGTASDVDGDGRLVVAGADGYPTAVAAGDIVHLR
jgi:BirA family transcriptional regulator, biotin operon repressor / biotin---[acetyl-CoA-carboxylase] ligase